jgi:3-dehydroquinate synthase
MNSFQILTNHARQVQDLLDGWLENGYTRNCSLPFNSIQTPEQVARLAASLFKRGGSSLNDTSSGNVVALNTPKAKELSQNETLVDIHKTVRSFFAQPIFNTNEGKSYFICDSSVLSAHPQLKSFLNSIRPLPFVFEPTEQCKNFATVLRILNSVEHPPQKVVVIGGGVCCDIGALVGSLLDAQVHLVPTTLLSAVDAGIGGKSGVNHPKAGKNQIGRFVSLNSVSIITELFQSLTPSQIRQGVAEMVKHSFLAGTFHHWQASLSYLINTREHIRFDHPDLIELLKQNISFKSSVVELDPFDKDIRNMLNFGHTIAHLIEATQADDALPLSHSTRGHTISHGIAVAIGMLALAESKLMKRLPEDFFEFLKSLLLAENIVFPLEINFTDQESARQFLQQDKKRMNKDKTKVRLIVPSYGSLAQIKQIADRTQFMADHTREIETDEFIKALKNSRIFT